MASSSEPITPTIQVVTLTDADTEYSLTLPVGTKHWSLQCRAAVDTRFAFVTALVATPTDPYMTLKSGVSYSSPEKFSGNPTIYMAHTAGSAPVMELLSWQAP
jgi:hypothetical protein